MILDGRGRRRRRHHRRRCPRTRRRGRTALPTVDLPVADGEPGVAILERWPRQLVLVGHLLELGRRELVADDRERHRVAPPSRHRASRRERSFCGPGTASPNIVSSWSSGSTRSRMRQRAAGIDQHGARVSAVGLAERHHGRNAAGGSAARPVAQVGDRVAQAAATRRSAARRSCCDSPQVMSTCTLMSKNSSETCASPLACHGVGPDSSPSSEMPISVDVPDREAPARR